MRKQLSGHILLGLYDSLNPQIRFTETPEKFINFKMVFLDPNTKKNNNNDDHDSLFFNGIKPNDIDGQYQYNLIDNSVGYATGKKTSDYVTTLLFRT